LKELPQKIISIRTCDKTHFQKEVYQNIFAESRRKYLEAENEKNGSKSSAKNSQFSSKVMSNYIMQLRKAANHPLLIRNHYTDDILFKMAKQIMREPEYCDANQEYIYEDMQYMSDFELHQLCKKFKSVRSFQLNEDKWMDSGKVQELQRLLPKMKANVIINFLFHRAIEF
jgi:SWI/SNF-related matrix-associated actin-dependent regulator 1 of chromatin subfamily A